MAGQEIGDQGSSVRPVTPDRNGLGKDCRQVCLMERIHKMPVHCCQHTARFMVVLFGYKSNAVDLINQAEILSRYLNAKGCCMRGKAWKFAAGSYEPDGMKGLRASVRMGSMISLKSQTSSVTRLMDSDTTPCRMVQSCISR